MGSAHRQTLAGTGIAASPHTVKSVARPALSLDLRKYLADNAHNGYLPRAQEMSLNASKWS